MYQGPSTEEMVDPVDSRRSRVRTSITAVVVAAGFTGLRTAPPLRVLAALVVAAESVAVERVRLLVLAICRERSWVLTASMASVAVAVDLVTLRWGAPRVVRLVVMVVTAS